VKRVVRSTNVPMAELPAPTIRSPSQCPGTARLGKLFIIKSCHAIMHALPRLHPGDNVIDGGIAKQQ
jgi:hypothetical protein